MTDAPTGPGDRDGSCKRPDLTDEERMLLHMRDTLYEGNWEDFVRDLESRRDGKPHVFDIVPASETLKQTIGTHLAAITRLRSWERANGVRLRADA